MDALGDDLSCGWGTPGAVTAWALRAEIGRFDRFHDGKQLARYCGLSPRNASSGQRQADAGLIKAGSELLRATLIEAARARCTVGEVMAALADVFGRYEGAAKW